MKISIIGAGNVGASIAYALCMREVCEEIVLLDVVANVAKAKSIDIAQASQIFGTKVRISGGDEWVRLAGSDMVIITAGSPRKAGQSREDLLLKNASVVKECAKNIAVYAPKAIIVVVTNPLDEMVWVAYKASGFAKERVLGMAGELDSARYRYEAAVVAGADESEMRGIVIGSHSDMMTLVRGSLSLNLSDDEFNQARESTINGGASIVKLLGTSAYYAPAAGVVAMCESVAGELKREVVASILVDDELVSGRLVRLDRVGLSEILKLDLSDDELKTLSKSEAKIRENINFLKQNI
ncbi:lactate/malate family dehydrogenase [Campylobacter sp. 19-13652]|uniref:lactate/malate family dehydrogenase n=1 Tax=Campylobacter sp. 19-13652 TaxID=2840180 RepID=UPI001C77F29A|nr:malate dehydrogenase [Campylobacter sp. 19-13652]BCX79533.1 malate dehydrogenase [Campylobacter sp. 19-13652]